MADHEEIEEVDEERQDEEIDKSGGGEEEEWKRYANMSLEEKRKYYTCRDSYIQLEDIETWPNYYQHNGYKFSKIQTFKIGKPPHKVDAKINDKVSLYVGDITKLEIDAIVNAANKSLLGGGGVDGCIHRAAGHTLVEECRLLNGCETGEAKITSGHRLPAKYVIHTVGSIGKNEKALKSCYENCLNVALENDVKTLAFCCISTGIYGYPNKDAAEVALRTTRKWLENQSNANGIDRIIFCLFLDKDIKIYESLMLKYFPPGERERSNRKTKERTKALTKTEKDKEPEAEKVPEDEDKDKEKQDEDVKEEEERKSPEDKDKEKQDEDVKEEEKRKSPEESEKLDVELETKPQETGETEKPNDKKEEKRTTKTEEMEIHEKLDEDNEKRLEKRAEYQKEELAKGTNDEEMEGSDGVVVPKPKKQKQESEPNENDEEKGQDVEMTNKDLQLRQRQEIEKKEEKVAQEENEQMEVEDSSGKQEKEVEDVVMRSKEKQVEETEESSEKQQDSEKEPPKQFETYV